MTVNKAIEKVGDNMIDAVVKEMLMVMGKKASV